MFHMIQDVNNEEPPIYGGFLLYFFNFSVCVGCTGSSLQCTGFLYLWHVYLIALQHVGSRLEGRFLTAGPPGMSLPLSLDFKEILTTAAISLQYF